MRRRAHPAGAGVLVPVLVLSGCGVFGGDGPEEIARRFLDAFSSGDTAVAARLTDSPDAARAVFDQAREALEPKSVSASLDEVHENDGRADADYRLDWDLGQGRTFGYSATARLHETDGEWTIRFRPAVVHPELAAGQTLALRTEEPELAPVLDRDGAQLMRPDRVVSVLLHPDEAGEELGEVVDSLAEALNPLDERITRESIENGVGEAEQGSPYMVAALRSEDYASVKPDIYELPGVRFTSRQRLLPVDRGLGDRILPAVRAAVAERDEGRAGWRVVTV
ncbi:NTF2-like N-terminal transpeptidase domain-containing protein, partial [Saccharomonospora saliphila]|uniref:NTF2-like N-terminal transpeptidase domain-containing protein n=1 Tax=Saccharomonospora saliphila TaxID=369829 RepID=UPI0006624904